MKYLKKYESHEDIDSICLKYDIENYTINSDGSIDVSGDVNLYRRKLSKLPLKFRNIEGYFNCEFNNLTSLTGCPKSVGRYFSCDDNKIDTFEGLDFIHIGNYFSCLGNPIWYIWDLFWDHTKFEFFNDCDIIRENRVIILDRLNFFLDYIDKPTVTKIEGYKCI